MLLQHGKEDNIYSANNVHNQIKVKGYKQYFHSNDFTVIHNEDTVELQIHITGNISIPANPSWKNLGNPVQSIPPKNTIVTSTQPQSLATICVFTDGTVAVSSTYSSTFNAQISATIRWSK